MHIKDLILGLDTSNYTTSAALVDCSDRVIADSRRLLAVKEGKRGLRQSEALFQHVNALPEIIDALCRQAASHGISSPAQRIAAVSVSSRPRPVEGSYMPCFLPGLHFGESMAHLLDVPCFVFSHQEGHIQALRREAGIDEAVPFMAFHMSGGTCELLLVQKEKLRILGGSKDISFGQLLDRTGVALGMRFPCGEAMDAIALQSPRPKRMHYKRIWMQDGWMQMAGLATAVQRDVEDGRPGEAVIPELFLQIAEALFAMAAWGRQQCSVNKLLLAGGVAASQTIKHYVTEYNKTGAVEILMPGGDAAKDNAIGIARLGRNKLWPSSPSASHN